MRWLFLFRLMLDFSAVGLLLTAFAYDWLYNAAHEVIGTVMFVLLIAHNVFNRRWYGSIRNNGREAAANIRKAINLSLLATMLVLLITSVVISQTVFTFLPFTSTFTARQIHTLAAYLALLIASIHLGMHWSLIMGIAGRWMSVPANSKIRTYVLRAIALIVATYGVHSLFAVNIGSRLFIQTTMELWDFQTSAWVFLVRHIAIIGLWASAAHYGFGLLQRRGATIASGNVKSPR